MSDSASPRRRLVRIRRRDQLVVTDRIVPDRQFEDSVEQQIAPSMYYARQQHEPSARARRDEVLKEEIAKVHHDNIRVFGARKMHIVLNREQDHLGRGLMTTLGGRSSLSCCTRRSPGLGE